MSVTSPAPATGAELAASPVAGCEIVETVPDRSRDLAPRSLIQVVAWPLVMAGAFATVVVSPTWVTTSAVIAAAGLLVFLLERVLPFRRDWVPGRRDWMQGLAYLAVSSAIAGGLQAVLTHGDIAAMSLGERSAWILGGLLVMDAGTYVAHRALHRTRVLWRVHAVHHALPRVWFLNALHNHVLDIALSTACGLVPLWALGFPPDVVGAVGALAVAHAWFQHANADLRLGWLNRVIAGPELHRWHHSVDRSEADANYGFVFAIWDVLFGTWRPPGSPAAIGVAGAPPMGTLAEQAIAPFRHLQLSTRRTDSIGAEAPGVRETALALVIAESNQRVA